MSGRKELAWRGFGPLAASTWLSPHDRLTQVQEWFADQPSVRLDFLQCRSSGLPVDREMATRCWDLDGLNRDYRELLRSHQRRIPAYRAGRLAAREAVVERTRLIYDYRKFPFRDPDLPLELLPAGWEVNAPAAGPTRGANLNMTLVDSISAQDADGKPVKPNVGIAFSIPVKKTATGETGAKQPDCAAGYLKAKNDLAKDRCQADRKSGPGCMAAALKQIERQRWDEAPTVIVYDAETVLRPDGASTCFAACRSSSR